MLRTDNSTSSYRNQLVKVMTSAAIDSSEIALEFAEQSVVFLPTTS